MNQEPTEPSIAPDSPDFLSPQGEVRRNSTGKANTQSSPSLSTSDEKPPLLHYLRASTGSCHDYCKYGRKHAFEGKARHPILRRSLGNNVIPEKEQNQAKVPPQERRKKKPMQKLKLTSEQETELSGHSNVVKNKVLSAAKDIQVCESGSEGFSEDSRSMMTRTPPSPQNRNSDKTDELSEELMSSYLIGPSIVEKSIITNELIVSTEDGFLEPMIVELAKPSPGRINVASVEILSATEAGEFFGELPDMKEMALPNLQGVIVGFSDSALINQEEGSGDILISKLSERPSLRECIVHVGEMTGNVSKEASNSSARHSLGNQAVKSSRDPFSTASKVSSSSSSFIKARSVKTSELNKREVPKLRSTPKPKNEMPVRAEVVSHKETNMLGKSSVIQQKAPSPAKKTRTSDQLKTIKQNSPNTTPSSTAKIIKSKTSSPSKKTDISARSSISLKAKNLVTKSQSPSTPRGLTGSRNQLSKISGSPDKTVEKKLLNLPRASLSPNIGENKVLKTPQASLYPKVGDKKVLKAPRVSLSPRPAVSRISSMKLGKNGNKRLASPVKNAKKVSEQDNDQVNEKTIYAIVPKTEIKSDEDVQQNPMNCKTSVSSQTLSVTTSQSSDASQENEENEENEETESTYTEASELSSEDEDTDQSDNEVESQEAEERRMSKKIISVHPEDEVQAPHKLKFRRGKIVDPQSENYGPRRLRFRKARVVTENQNGKGESGRRSFRKRSDISGADSNVVPEAPNVVLRHQDQQGKKDTQGLFNHVIEETASKLVETRKSKVKALVGAFETVISLQETKVAPTG